MTEKPWGGVLLRLPRAFCTGSSIIAGDLQALFMLVKGLPLAYNRHLQEGSSITDRLGQGHLDATAVMEYLICRGTPQRTAHGVVGRLVRRAMLAG